MSGRLGSSRDRNASMDCLEGQVRHIEYTLDHFNCCVPGRAPTAYEMHLILTEHAMFDSALPNNLCGVLKTLSFYRAKDYGKMYNPPSFSRLVFSHKVSSTLRPYLCQIPATLKDDYNRVFY